MRRGLICAIALSAAFGQQAPRLVQTIPMPDVEGRIDHLAVDLEGKRLFIAALGNNTMEVLDLAAGKRVATIKGLHEPQGIAYVAGLNRIFVANGEDGKCHIYDGGSLKLVDTVDFSGDADNVRYDAGAKHIWVGYGKGALGEMDAASGKRLGDVALKGHPESFQLEKSGPRIFVNVPSAGHIAVVDRQKRAVIATWPVEQARSNYPMALDEAGHRLYIGCRKPPRVLVYDTNTGRVTASVEFVGDTDDLFYDAARKRLYVSGGEGFLSVFEQRGDGQLAPVGKVATAAGARTGLYVPELKRFYLAVPHRGAQRAEVRAYE